jgi:flagellar biosynthesis protein FliR
VPAFIVYSTLRLLVMGMVARFAPAQIELFHVYIMVLVNIGFVMLVWMYWLKEVVLSARGERD